MGVQSVVCLCLSLVIAVWGDVSSSGFPTIHRLPQPVDCQRMVQSAPEDSPWIPQCDSSNRLLPLQVKKDGSKFCTDIYVASVLLEDVNDATACACLTEAQEMRHLSRKPLYVPECDPVTGRYLSKQCNRRQECWCVGLDGRQLGPKWGGSNKSPMVLGQQGSAAREQYRPSCEIITKYWTGRSTHNSTSQL